MKMGKEHSTEREAQRQALSMTTLGMFKEGRVAGAKEARAEGLAVRWRGGSHQIVMGPAAHGSFRFHSKCDVKSYLGSDMTRLTFLKYQETAV